MHNHQNNGTDDVVSKRTDEQILPFSVLCPGGKDTDLGVNRTELETLFYCVKAGGIGKLFNFSEP